MESEKRPYETKTASISIYFEELMATRQGGTYKGPLNVIKVKSTQKAEFEEVFEGLFKLGEIPKAVILQSANGYTAVQVKLAKNEKKPGDAAASPFRPRRKKLQKSGKKSGKVRKNKKSKKSRN